MGKWSGEQWWSASSEKGMWSLVAGGAAWKRHLAAC